MDTGLSFCWINDLLLKFEERNGFSAPLNLQQSLTFEGHIVIALQICVVFPIFYTS